MLKPGMESNVSFVTLLFFYKNMFNNDVTIFYS